MQLKLVLILQNIFRVTNKENFAVKVRIMSLKIKAKKVKSKTIRPARSSRTNSVLANSSNSFLTPGSVAILGVLLFIAFVLAQIIIII